MTEERFASLVAARATIRAQERKSQFASEVDLLKPVIKWLADQDFTVYQEVDECDIVATRGPLVWIIEGKLRASFKVFDQALRRKPYAHQVFIAIPKQKELGSIARCAKALGIGILAVSGDYLPIRMVMESQFQRKILDRIVKRCSPEHQTFTEAGSNRGGRWTPWRSTCTQIGNYVTRNPGATLKQTLEAIKHHYDTDVAARRSLRVWIERGRVPGVRSEKQGREIRLYPESPGPSAAQIAPEKERTA